MNFLTVLSSILAVALALGFVLLLAWGTLFLLKKWQDRQMASSSGDGEDWSIHFVRSMPLGQRERVAIIEVRGETLLIGITAGSMSVLQRWPRASAAAALDTAHLPNRPGGAL